jgi:hypothetical protein
VAKIPKTVKSSATVEASAVNADQVEIEIRIELSATWPTEAESDMRNKIEDQVVGNKLGQVVDAGSGLGEMDIWVRVPRASAAEALESIRAVVQGINQMERSTIALHDAQAPA